MKVTCLLAIVLSCDAATSALAQLQGPSTLQSSYMVPATPGVRYISIASNGNGTSTPNETFPRLNVSPVAGSAAYRFVGIPDGMGILRTPEDIQAGQFTVLCNHELGNASGIVRDHGSRGALVSLWKVDARETIGGEPNPSFLRVIGGQDLIQRVWLWNAVTGVFSQFDASNRMPLYRFSGAGASTWWDAQGAPIANPSNDGFGRFCSADLGPVSAFRWVDGQGQVFGTEARIFLNGEESGAPGRAFAHIVTGPAAGTSWELPAHGKYSWENNVASPFPQRKTVVVGLDDSGGGQIAVWVGDKKPASAAASDVDAAGLIDGRIYVLRVAGTTAESTANGLGTSSFVASAPFTLADMGDVRNITGAAFQTLGDSLGQMTFSRPEDGQWDIINPNRFYFATTASVGNRSRLWAVNFADVTQPELGGTIEIVLDGNVPSSVGASIVSATGATSVEMMDNLTVTKAGLVYIQEDVGGVARSGREWIFNPVTRVATEIGRHSPAVNGDDIGGVVLPTAPFNNNEETSGVVDAFDIIGPGWFILCDQQHYGISGELVEGGQMMAAFVPQTLIGAACYANCDGSTIVPVLNALDFSCFLNQFVAGNAYANCDGSTIVPALNALDFSCYLNRYVAGCGN